jgi:hypothetical protein
MRCQLERKAAIKCEFIFCRHNSWGDCGAAVRHTGCDVVVLMKIYVVEGYKGRFRIYKVFRGRGCLPGEWVPDTQLNKHVMVFGGGGGGCTNSSGWGGCLLLTSYVTRR